jgi:hypothetical protein
LLPLIPSSTTALGVFKLLFDDSAICKLSFHFTLSNYKVGNALKFNQGWIVVEIVGDVEKI